MKTLHLSIIVIGCIIGVFAIWYFTSYAPTPVTKQNNGILSGDVILAGGPLGIGTQKNYEVDVYATDGVTFVAKTLIDTNAHYSIPLPAGNYIIYAPDYPTKQTYHVSVFSGKNTNFNIGYGAHYK